MNKTKEQNKSMQFIHHFQFWSLQFYCKIISINTSSHCFIFKICPVKRLRNYIQQVISQIFAKNQSSNKNNFMNLWAYNYQRAKNIEARPKLSGYKLPFFVNENNRMGYAVIKIQCERASRVLLPPLHATIVIRKRIGYDFLCL